MTAHLFSYGTLRDASVQQALFGRLIEERPDTLIGYRLGTIEMEDETVLTLSGKAIHLILRYSGDPADRIAGAMLSLTEAEICIADVYETDAYTRIAATLESGTTAWVYVDAADPAAVAAPKSLR